MTKFCSYPWLKIHLGALSMIALAGCADGSWVNTKTGQTVEVIAVPIETPADDPVASVSPSPSPSPSPSASASLSPDTTPPTIGTGLAVATVTPYTIGLTWGAATDDVTAASSLQYKIVSASLTTSIDTIAEADAVTGDNLILDWTTNLTSKTVGTLYSATAYAFAVLVKDAAGNMALYTPVSQSTPTITHAKLAALSNGNVIAVYRDTSDSNKGKAIVIDSNFEVIAGPTVFETTGVNADFGDNIGVTALSGGGAAIMYESAASIGKFVVLSNSLSSVVASTTYMNEAAFFNDGIAVYDSGKLFIISGRPNFSAGGSQGCGYAVFNSADGSAIKAITGIFNGGGGNEMRGVAAAAIGAARAIGIYSIGWSTLTLRYFIADNTGTIQVADSAAAITRSDSFTTVTLGNSNAMLVARDVSDSNKGKLVVYDSTGAAVVGATQFAASVNGGLAASVRSSGNVILNYSDASSSSVGKYVIYQPDGTVAQTAQALTTFDFRPESSALFGNGSLAVVGTANSTNKYLKIVSSP